MIKRLVFFTIAFILLTVITQVGGIIVLLCIPIFRWIRHRMPNRKRRFALQLGSFLLFYTALSAFLIPPIAARFGRVPLPTEASSVTSLRYFTIWCNRHYVTPQLKAVLLEAGETMAQEFPNTAIYYLDANFPFYNGFPLLPHLSHNDGKKVDLAFYYQDPDHQDPLYKASPSWMGYGAFEKPQRGEHNQPERCESQGHWHYSLLEWFAFFPDQEHHAFDAKRTKRLTQLLGKDHNVQKIFLEPHLKRRLGLTSPKVRYQGCRAVRHDDHLHVQVH